MAKWIDADLLLKEIDKIRKRAETCENRTYYTGYMSATSTVQGIIAGLQRKDVVSEDAYKQVAWERDMAMKQIESYGVSFGSNAELAKIKHGYWKRPTLIGGLKTNLPHCSVCGKVPCDEGDYCPKCGAKMDSKEQ